MIKRSVRVLPIRLTFVAASLASGIGLPLGPCPADESVPPTLSMVWAGIQRGERELRSASVKLHGRYSRRGEPEREFRCMVHFDDGRWRCDVSRRTRDQQGWYTEYACLGCTAPEEYVFWSDQQLGSDGAVSLTIYPRNAVPDNEQRPSVDVRRLGLVPVSVMSTALAPLEPIWNLSPTAAGEVKSERLDSQGDRYWKLSWQVGSLRRECWLAIDKDLSVVRLEVARDGRTRTVVRELAASASEPKLWLPTRILLEEQQAGVRTESETCDVEWLAVNAVVEPSPFSIRSFETLKPGTSVTRSAERPQADARLFWDGEQIVTRPMGELMLMTPSMPSSTKSRSTAILLWLNAAIACGLLAGLLVRRLKRSRAGADPSAEGSRPDRF